MHIYPACSKDWNKKRRSWKRFVKKFPESAGKKRRSWQKKSGQHLPT